MNLLSGVPMSALLVAYAANITILVPVCFAMLRGTEAVFEGTVAPSDGLRLLVFSLWAAILLASVLGLVWPAVFWPVLLLQVIYKSLYLAIFVAPRVVAGLPVPRGVTATFAAIVALWPFLIAAGFGAFG
jgi:hypothetical protein